MNLTKTNRMARIIVSDTGVGIPADALPHIFDRFYRVDKARTRAQGGSGLGLSICKSIVDAHKGTIVVRSEVDQGSTFTVTLPVYPGGCGGWICRTSCAADVIRPKKSRMDRRSMRHQIRCNQDKLPGTIAKDQPGANPDQPN